MNIKIKSTMLDVSPAVEEYATKKVNSLEKFLPKGLGGEALCEVELAKTTGHRKSGDIYKAEINIIHEGRQIYAVAETDDLYGAIDKMRDEAERVIISKKEKQKALFRRGATKLKNLIKKLYR